MKTFEINSQEDKYSNVETKFTISLATSTKCLSDWNRSFCNSPVMRLTTGTSRGLVEIKRRAHVTLPVIGRTFRSNLSLENKLLLFQIVTKKDVMLIWRVLLWAPFMSFRFATKCYKSSSLLLFSMTINQNFCFQQDSPSPTLIFQTRTSGKPVVWRPSAWFVTQRLVACNLTGWKVESAELSCCLLRDPELMLFSHWTPFNEEGGREPFFSENTTKRDGRESKWIYDVWRDVKISIVIVTLWNQLRNCRSWTHGLPRTR